MKQIKLILTKSKPFVAVNMKMINNLKITTHITLSNGKYAAKDTKWIALTMLEGKQQVMMPTKIKDKYDTLELRQAKMEKIDLKLISVFGVPTF